MLAAAKVLSRVQGHGITLLPDGDRLRFRPASALTPELREELRQHKEDILSILRRREEVQQDTSPLIENASEVRQIAREVLGPVENPVTPPPPPGRDPLVHRDTDKARFFRGDWRSVPPTDWTPYRHGGSA
jgi:hypothetical protein